MPDNKLYQQTLDIFDQLGSGAPAAPATESGPSMDQAVLTGTIMKNFERIQAERINALDNLDVSEQKKDYLRWVAMNKSPEELEWAKDVMTGKTSKQMEDNWFTRGAASAAADAAIAGTAGALAGTVVPGVGTGTVGAIGAAAGAAEGFVRGALKDNANFYIDDKTGMPVPLRAGERIPFGKSLSEVFGNREAEDDNAVTTLGKGLYDGFIDIGRSLPNIANMLQGTVTGKDSEFLNQISNSVDNMKLDVNPEAMTSIVTNPSLQNYSYVLGQGLGSLAQFIGGGGLVGAGAKAGEAASVASKLGILSNPFTDARALAVSTAVNFNESYDAATNAGLTGAGKTAYVLPTALAIGALELAVGGQEMQLLTKKALLSGAAKRFSVEMAEKGVANVTAESIEKLYKDVIKNGLQNIAVAGKHMFKDAIGEGTEEAVQALTSQIDQVIYDKVSGDPAFNTNIGSHSSFVDLAENAIGGGLVGFVAGAANLQTSHSLDRQLFDAIKNNTDKPLLAQVNALMKNNQITAEDHDIIMSKYNAFKQYNKEVTNTEAVLNDDEKKEMFGEAWQASYAQQQMEKAQAQREKQVIENGSSTFFDTSIQFYAEKKAKHDAAMQKIMQEGMKRKLEGQPAPVVETKKEETPTENHQESDQETRQKTGQVTDNNLFNITASSTERNENKNEQQTEIEKRREAELHQRIPKKSEIWKDDEDRYYRLDYTNDNKIKLFPVDEEGKQIGGIIAEYSDKVEPSKFINNAEKVSNFEFKNQQEFIDKINAKYDAELKTLKPEKPAVTEKAEKITTIPKHTRVNEKNETVPHYSRIHDELSQAFESETPPQITGEIEKGAGMSSTGYNFTDTKGNKVTFYNHANDKEVSPITAEDLTAEAHLEKGEDFKAPDGKVRKVINVVIGDRIVGRVRESDTFDKKLPEGASVRTPLKEEPKKEVPKKREPKEAKPEPTKTSVKPTRGSTRIVRDDNEDPTEETKPVAAEPTTKEAKLAAVEARKQARNKKIDTSAAELLKKKFNPNTGPQTFVGIVPIFPKAADAVYRAAIVLGRETLKAGSNLEAAIEKAIIHIKSAAGDTWRKMGYYEKAQVLTDIRQELEVHKRVAELLSEKGFDDESAQQAADLLGVTIEEIRYMKFGDGNYYAASEKAFNKFFVNDKGEAIDPNMGLYELKTLAHNFFTLNNPSEANVREMVKNFKGSDALRKHWLNLSDNDLIQLNNFIKSSVLVPYLHLSNYTVGQLGYALKISNPAVSKKGLREILKRQFNKNFINKDLRKNANNILNAYDTKKQRLKKAYGESKMAATVVRTEDGKQVHYFMNVSSKDPSVVSVAQQLQVAQKSLLNYTSRSPEFQQRHADEIKVMQENIDKLTEIHNELIQKSDMRSAAKALIDLDVQLLHELTGFDQSLLQDFLSENTKGYPTPEDWYMANEINTALYKFLVAPNVVTGVDLQLKLSERNKDGSLTPGFQRTFLGDPIDKKVPSQIGTIGSQQERRSVAQQRYGYEFDNVVKDNKSAHEFFSTMTLMAKEIGDTKTQSLARLADNLLVKMHAGKALKYFKIDGLKNTTNNQGVGVDRMSVSDLELIAFAAFLNDNKQIGIEQGMYPQFYDQQSDSTQEYMMVVPKRGLEFFKDGQLLVTKKIATEAELANEIRDVATNMKRQVDKKTLTINVPVEQAAKAYVYNYMYNKFEMDQYFRGTDPQTDPKYTYAVQAKRKANGQGELLNLHIPGGIGEYARTVVIKDHKFFHPFAPKNKDGSEKAVDGQDGQMIVLDHHNDRIEKSSGTKYGGVVKDYYMAVTDPGHQVNFKGNTIVLSKELAAMNPAWKALYDWAKQNNLDRIVFESAAKRGPSTGAVKVLDPAYNDQGIPQNLPQLKDEDIYMARNDRFFIQQNLANDGLTKPGHLPVQLLTVMKRLPAGSAIEAQFSRVVQLRAQELKKEWARMGTQERKQWVIDRMPDTPYYASIKNMLADKNATINNPAFYNTINNLFQSEIERRVLNINVNKNVAVTSSLPGTQLKSLRKEGDDVKLGEVYLPYGMSQGKQKISINPDPNKQELVIVIRSPLDDVHSISVLIPRAFLPESSKNAIIPSADVNILNGGDHDGDILHVWTKFKNDKGEIIKYNSKDKNPSPEAVTNHVFDLVAKSFQDKDNFEAITAPTDPGAVEKSIEQIKASDEGSNKNRYAWGAWKYQVASNKESAAVIGMSINALKVFNDLRAYSMALKNKAEMELPTWKNGTFSNVKRTLKEFFSNDLAETNQNYRDMGSNVQQVLDNPKLGNLFAMRKLKATTYMFDALKMLYLDQDTTINFFNHPTVREYVKLVNELDSPTANKSDNSFRILEKRYGDTIDKRPVWEKDHSLPKEVLNANNPTAKLTVLNFLEYLKYVSDDIEGLNKFLRANDKAIRSFGNMNEIGIAMDRLMNNRFNAININPEYIEAGSAFQKATENLEFAKQLYDDSFHRTTFASGIIQQILAEANRVKFNPRETKEGKNDAPQPGFIRGTEDNIENVVKQLWQWITIQARGITQDVNELREEALSIYNELPEDHFLKELLVQTADGKLGLHDDFIAKTPDMATINSANRAFAQLGGQDLNVMFDYMIREYGYTQSLKSGSFFAYLPASLHADLSMSAEVRIQELKEDLHNDLIDQVTREIIAKNIDLIPQAVNNRLVQDLGVYVAYNLKDEPLSDPPQLIKIRTQEGKWKIYQRTMAENDNGELVPGYNEENSYNFEDRGYGNNYDYTATPHEERNAENNGNIDHIYFQEPVEFGGLKVFDKKDTLSGKKENQSKQIEKGERNKIITEGQLTQIGGKIKIGDNYYIAKAITNLSEQGFKDQAFIEMVSRHMGITEAKVKTMISTGQINDGSQIITLEKTQPPPKLNLMDDNVLDEQLASENAELRDFIRDHFAKMYPEIQLFNNPQAFQEFLDRNFPGRKLPMTALGAAIGRTIYIDPNSAVQSTDFHENAHIYWDALPENEPSKIQLLKKFGSEENAILAIGRAGVDVAKDAFGRRPNKEGVMYVLKKFWAAVKRLFHINTRQDMVRAFAQDVWNNNAKVKANDFKSGLLKMMQADLSFPEHDHMISELNVILEGLYGEGVTLESATAEQIAKMLVDPLPNKEDETIWQTMWQGDHNVPLSEKIFDEKGNEIDALGRLPVMPKEAWTKAKYGADYKTFLLEKEKGNDVALQQIDHFYKEYVERMAAINEIITKELRTEDDIYNATDKELVSILESMKSKELLNQDNKGFDPTAEMIRKVILDRLGARQLAEAVKKEIKSNGKTNRRYLAMLWSTRTNKDSDDLSSLASGTFGKDLAGPFISPGDLKSEKAQLHEQIHKRIGIRKTRDFRYAADRLENAYKILRKNKINVKDLIIPASNQRETDKWLLSNSLDSMRDEMLSQYTDAQVEQIRDFLKTREDIMQQFGGALGNPNNVDSVAYAQADFPELLKRFRQENGIIHAIAKTLRIKTSKEAPYDHLHINYRDSSGAYLRLSEMKQEIENQVANKQLTEKEATTALYKYSNQAKELWHNRKELTDYAGEIIDHSHERKINLRTRFGQNESTTANIEASDIQFLERLIYKYHADPFVPMLEFLNEYAGRSRQEQLRKYLENMDSHRLYGENPESRMGKMEPYIKSLNGYTVLKLLAMNFGVAPFNMFAALAQNTREFGFRKTFAGMITTLAGLDRGKWTTVPSGNMEKGYIDSKIFNILRKQELVEVGHNLEVSTSSKFFQKLKKILFVPTTFAEFINHGNTLAALLSQQQLDAYDKDGNVVDEEHALSEDQWIRVINEARRIHGAYHESMRRPIGFTAEGQMVMLMKNWLPDVLRAHFSKEFIDSNDITRKGIVNSYLDTFNDVFRPKNDQGERQWAGPGEWSQNYAELSEIDKLNLRKGMRELVMLGMMMFLYFGMTDDKKNQRKVGRALGDIAFFYDLNNWKFLLQNPFPTTSAVVDILDATKAAFNTLSGDQSATYQKSGKYGEKGDSKLGAAVLKTLPGKKIVEQVTE